MAPCLIALSSTARRAEEGTCLCSLSESLSQGCACGIVWLGCSELTDLYSNMAQELEQLSLFLADMERKYAVRASCLRCERPGGKKHMWSWEDAKYFRVNWYASARWFEGRVFVKRGFFQVCCKRKHNPAGKNLQKPQHTAGLCQAPSAAPPWPLQALHHPRVSPLDTLKELQTLLILWGLYCIGSYLSCTGTFHLALPVFISQVKYWLYSHVFISQAQVLIRFLQTVASYHSSNLIAAV